MLRSRLYTALIHAPNRSAGRIAPFCIGPGRIAGPHLIPSRQFQALFDSLFKVLFIFTSRYLFAIGLSPIFSLGRNLRPIGAAFPNNLTRRQRLLVRKGLGMTRLSPSLAPLFRELGPGPSLRTLLQTTIRTPNTSDFQAGLFPVHSPLLRESLLVSFPPLMDMLKLSGSYAYDPTKTEVLGMDERITTESVGTVRNRPTESDVSSFSGRSVYRTSNHPRRRDPNTSPDHSIGRSDGRCVQRAGT
ncbi:hypothetical protein YC2023_004402 [Brassica napus]